MLSQGATQIIDRRRLTCREGDPVPAEEKRGQPAAAKAGATPAATTGIVTTSRVAGAAVATGSPAAAPAAAMAAVAESGTCFFFFADERNKKKKSQHSVQRVSLLAKKQNEKKITSEPSTRSNLEWTAVVPAWSAITNHPTLCLQFSRGETWGRSSDVVPRGVRRQVSSNHPETRQADKAAGSCRYALPMSMPRA